jgi:hypothetical protein
MAKFATEEDVRLRFQLNDETLTPSALIEACITAAHEETLLRLDPLFSVEPPANALAVGEAMLSGAYMFRALAGKDAADQRQLTIGGQRLDAGSRFQALIDMAALTEERAWYVLEPFMKRRDAAVLAGTTDTVPVLGEA